MTTNVTRQVRRAAERAAIRETMTKTERRFLFRCARPLRREVYFTTLNMIASGQMTKRHG